MSFDEYSSGGEPRCGPPEYTRVYRLTGHYAHLQTTDGFRDVLCLRDQRPCCLAKTCCCGDLTDEACSCRHVTEYDPDTWLGTGAQVEYEKAAALSLCPACFTVRERQFPDARLGRGHRVDLRDLGGGGPRQSTTQRSIAEPDTAQNSTAQFVYISVAM